MGIEKVDQAEGNVSTLTIRISPFPTLIILFTRKGSDIQFLPCCDWFDDTIYRQYTEDDVARIQFIKRAKKLGFSLKEISELLFLRVDPDTTCGEVRREAEMKIAAIEEKLKDLRRMKEALESMVAMCRGAGPSNDCPILEALDVGEQY